MKLGSAALRPVEEVPMLERSGRLDAVRRYTGLDLPEAPTKSLDEADPSPLDLDDGSFERIARMAAKIFATPMATVSIVDEDRVWFLATQGLAGVTEIGIEPGLCTSAIHEPGPYVVNDASADPRTAHHPLVVSDLGVRFYAAAPITVDGHALGTVNVLDRKRHRRVTGTQTALLADLADTVAELLQVRLAALTGLRLERAAQAAEADRREQAERAAEQRSSPDEDRPRWCQLGGTGGCRKPAEAKVADSWGDSAWGCWPHAEEALINVVPVFLAIDSTAGLSAYRARVTPPD
jgi:GAF domain-containing protein